MHEALEVYPTPYWGSSHRTSKLLKRVNKCGWTRQSKDFWLRLLRISDALKLWKTVHQLPHVRSWPVTDWYARWGNPRAVQNESEKIGGGQDNWLLQRPYLVGTTEYEWIENERIYYGQKTWVSRQFEGIIHQTALVHHRGASRCLDLPSNSRFSRWFSNSHQKNANDLREICRRIEGEWPNA